MKMKIVTTCASIREIFLKSASNLWVKKMLLTKMLMAVNNPLRGPFAFQKQQSMSSRPSPLPPSFYATLLRYDSTKRMGVGKRGMFF